MADDVLKQRAVEYVGKWAERSHHRLTRETKSYVQQTAILLWRMEALGRKDAAGFAAAKWRRLGALLTDCVRAAEKKREGDLRFAQITIRKVFGDCSHEWMRIKPSLATREDSMDCASPRHDTRSQTHSKNSKGSGQAA